MHVLKASVRFRNTTNQPVVLGYIADSAVVTDNNGNRYEAQVNQRGDGAAGIGTVTRAKANPQFVLAPGASRDATFTVSRYKRDSKIGSTFTFDLTIAHLEVLAWRADSPAPRVRGRFHRAHGRRGQFARQTPAAATEIVTPYPATHTID